MEKAVQEAGRKRLRQHLLREALYFPLKDGEQSRFAGHANVHRYDVNFHVGIDFPAGATRIVDLYPHARPILSTFLNSLALLQGLKKRPVDPDRKKPKNRKVLPAPDPYFDVERYFECGFDRKEDTFNMMRFTALVVEKVHPDMIARRLARMVVSEAEEGNENEEESAAGGVPLEDASSDAEGTLLNAKYCKSPLTYGMYLSCLEGRDLRQLANKERAAARNKSKSFYEAHRFRQYAFAEFETLEAFFFGAVQHFYSAHGLPHGADENEAFLQVHETSSYRESEFDRKSLRNLDNIFTKERAMIDRTFDSRSEQSRLSNYVHGAYEPENEEDPLLAEGDDMDLEDLLEQRQDPAPAPPRVRRTRHVSDYQQNGVALYRDSGQVKWPRRPAVFRLNDRACLSEIAMTLWPLPFPAGTTYKDVAKGFQPLADEQRVLHMVCQLEETEKTLSLAPDTVDHSVRHTSHVAIGTGVRMETQHVDMETHTMEEVLDTLPDIRLDDEQEEAATESTKERHAAMRLSQTRVVLRTLGDLSEHYRKRGYAEMVYQNDDTYVFMTESTTNRMALAEFNTVGNEDRNATHGNLQRAQQMLSRLKCALDKSGIELTSEAQNYILSRVDVFPEWMVNRQAALEMRQESQLGLESLRYRYKNGRDRIRERPDHTPEELEKHANAEQVETRSFYENAYESLFDKFLNSNGFSRAFVEARDFWKNKILPQGASLGPDTVLSEVLQVRPYVRFQQFKRDTFVASEKVSEQNLPYLERAYNCVYHAHRFYPRRSEPAMNYTMAGSSGVGKSYVIRVCEYLAPPGIMQNMTNATTAAFNVDEDFDNCAFAYEELDTGFLFSNTGGAKDTGATDKINYLKARSTSFATITQYFRYNEETKQREAGRCYSSCHMVMISATNQNLDGMDNNVRRRLILNHIAERVGVTDGGRSIDSDTYSLFEHSNEGTRIKRLHQELHMAYMFVETAIKAAVEPDVTDDGARTGIFCTHKEVNTKQQIAIDKSTKKNWVLEGARTETIQYACFMALFSPTFNAVYKDLASGITRWGPSMFNQVVSPLLYIGKDQVKHATTMYDFLYSSREEEQMFLTIANRLCHMGTPELWQFRKEAGQERGETKLDYNYFALRGASLDGLCGIIAVANNENSVQLRPNDVLGMLRPYEKSWTEIADIYPLTTAADSVKPYNLQVAPDSFAKKVRQAIIIERDPTSATKGAHQISFSVQFFLSRYGIDFAKDKPEEIKAKLHAERPVLNGRWFGRSETGSTESDIARGWIEAAKLTQCSDVRSPLVAAMRHVYSNKTLEYSPYEHPQTFPLPDACRKYFVFYTPDPAKVSINAKETLTVPLHGVIQMIENQRLPDGPLLQRRNYDRPLPTAATLLFRDKAPTRPEMMRGFIVDHHDIDFLMAVKRMEIKCHQGIRFLERTFVKDIAAEAAIHNTVPEIRRLAEDVDANRPARNPLPFNFAPILYRFELHFGTQTQQQPYPAVNAGDRIHDSVFSNDGTSEAFTSYDQSLGLKRRFQDAIPRREDGDPNAMDIDEVSTLGDDLRKKARIGT